jgi:hypothetical protein
LATLLEIIDRVEKPSSPRSQARREAGSNIQARRG